MSPVFFLIDNLTQRQQTFALFLEVQARLGLSERTTARRLLCQVFARDPSHAFAADFLSVFA
jgi:hypothetical protein